MFMLIVYHLENYINESSSLFNANGNGNKHFITGLKNPNKLVNKIKSLKSLSNNTQINSNPSNTVNSIECKKFNPLKTNEEIKNYEEEVYEKIKDEQLFDNTGYKKEDILGNFIDRVITGSLYVYRNK